LILNRNDVKGERMKIYKARRTMQKKKM